MADWCTAGGIYSVNAPGGNLSHFGGIAYTLQSEEDYARVCVAV